MKVRLSLVWTAAVCAAGCSSAQNDGATIASKHPARLAAQEVSLSAARVAARDAWTHALDGVPAPVAAPGADRSTKFPAFKPDTPRLVWHGGTSLHAPRIVTVTWNDDPSAGTYEAFDDQIGGSSYWRVMSEWGAGPAVGGGHVRVPGPFPSTSDNLVGQDSTLQDYIRAKALDPSSGWPQYTDQTLYVLWLPAGADLTLFGGSPACSRAQGYHSNTVTQVAEGGTAPPIVYAVVLNCNNITEGVTTIGSHEIAEATSDPLSIGLDMTGLNSFDDAHGAYDVYFYPGAEIGDLCGWTVQQQPLPFDFVVQRLWSNASLAGGRDPCVPSLGRDVYYNATTFPAQTDDLHVDLTATGYGGPMVSKGFKVPLGQSRTFDVGFYSDGPTGDWPLRAIVRPTLPIVDTNGNPIANGDVEVSIDRPVGRNGHVAHVTVTPKTAGAGIGAAYVELESGFTDYPTYHSLPILVGQD